MLIAIRTICLLALLSFAGASFSTAQAPDKIVIEGKEHALNTNPLGPYLQKQGESAPRFEAHSSALWRGYIATWKLAAGKLFLIRVDVFRENPSASQDDNNSKMTRSR